MKIWRLIGDDGVSASFGLAADEYMARQVGTHASAPMLRLYTYHSYCALVGRHQSVVAEINRTFCEQHQIALNRRPTGGGAIIMGAEQLGIALILPLGASNGQTHRVRELFATFSAGIIAGLRTLGVDATFGGKNDIEVGRKKIAGLGVYHDRSGGLLFHASVLVDLDIALMLQILNTPFEKISDKAISTVAHRVTTVRRESGQACALESVRRAIARGYEQQLQVKLEASVFTPSELEGITQLEREKYLTPEWIEQKTLGDDSVGRARVKTPGGLLNVELTLAGDVIKAIYITGDFFAEAESVAALERELRWGSGETLAIEQRVTNVYRRMPEALENIMPADLTRAIARAVDDAHHQVVAAETYGCFVNP